MTISQSVNALRKLPARAAAAKILEAVFSKGQSLSALLPKTFELTYSAFDQRFIQALCFGVCRFAPRLEWLLSQLMKKPLKSRDEAIRCLLLIGLYQLEHMRVSDHAAVSETVAAVGAFNRPWAKSLVNGVLRSYCRERDRLRVACEQDPVAHYAHPLWLIEKIKAAWPEHWEAILTANNIPAPMTLRVNARKTTREAYLKQLQDAEIKSIPVADCPHGIQLETPCAVSALPGFMTGACSVQDGAAQLVVPLLQLEPGLRVLDACAAPGGKTTHILEQQPDLAELVAIDSDPHRLEKVKDNLDRLDLEATLHAQDATTITPDNPFDRILLDAPCSATGVIRRHPDIKLLRRPTDIAALAAQQLRLLEVLWKALKPQGCLVYTTCSIFPEENAGLIAAFLEQHPDAEHQVLEVPWGQVQSYGVQRFPGEDDMDGFFYACLCKK